MQTWDRQPPLQTRDDRCPALCWPLPVGCFEGPAAPDENWKLLLTGAWQHVWNWGMQNTGRYRCRFSLTLNQPTVLSTITYKWHCSDKVISASFTPRKTLQEFEVVDVSFPPFCTRIPHESRLPFIHSKHHVTISRGFLWNSFNKNRA